VTNTVAEVAAVSVADVAVVRVGNNPEVGHMIAEVARRIRAIERGT
jgi:hypothetical protein